MAPLEEIFFVAVHECLDRDEALAEISARARAKAPVADDLQANPKKILLSDIREGRSASWYAAEAAALAADLEAVAARHNAALARAELERRRREQVRAKLHELANHPLFSSHSSGEAVLARIAGRFGLMSADLDGKGHAPPACVDPPHLVRGYPVAKYSLRVVLEARLPDDEVDPEVLEILDEQQAQWEANGDGKRGGRTKAHLVEAGLLRPEERLAKIPGSGAKKRKKITAVWRRLDDDAEEVVLYED